MPGDSSTTADPPGMDVLEKAGKRHRSNKIRSHTKQKRERANERKKREAGGQPCLYVAEGELDITGCLL
jgi:hypothetical protein